MLIKNMFTWEQLCGYILKKRGLCRTTHIRKPSLTDNCGGGFVRVRGVAKVKAHLTFGVIALTVAQVFRLIG